MWDGPRRRRHDGWRFWVALIHGLLRVATVVQASWVDPDTPARHNKTLPLTPWDNREFRLVSLVAGVERVVVNARV